MVFIGLFLHRMPQTVWDHLLVLDIQDLNALAKKADALFQSQQSSSVHLLFDDPTSPIYAIPPSKPRTRCYSNSSTSQSTSSGRSSTLAASHHQQRSLSPQHAGSIELMETKPRRASNPAPGRKTNWPARRNAFFYPAGTSSSLLYLRTLSLPGIFFLIFKYIYILYRCSYVLSSRHFRYTGWRSTPATCAIILVPLHLLLTEAV